MTSGHCNTCLNHYQDKAETDAWILLKTGFVSILILAWGINPWIFIRVAGIFITDRVSVTDLKHTLISLTHQYLLVIIHYFKKVNDKDTVLKSQKCNFSKTMHSFYTRFPYILLRFWCIHLPKTRVSFVYIILLKLHKRNTADFWTNMLKPELLLLCKHCHHGKCPGWQ